VKSQTLEITGMTCGVCARHVERALLSVPGVHTADVSYPEGTARVTGDAVNAAVLASAVTGAGYRATVSDGAAVGCCPPRVIVTPLCASPSSAAAARRWRRR
jgi:mercuric reductase